MSQNRSKSFLLGAFLGSVAGATLGLLYAPDRGEKTRKKLSEEKERLKQKAQGLKEKVEKKGGVSKAVDNALREVGRTIKNLDLPTTKDQVDRKETEWSDLTQTTNKTTESARPKKKPRYFRGTKG